ncbi:MAG: hypothetical protein AVDCRST_MAG09-1982 [uncultured Sphingomonas sp.]|uniref:Uncharacterized protein n=1 Tax=uncultured Sphingomonas sp. TaxID=158754 RepID=A0A6J4T9A7_9SPHN|nr:MAG: hypothetical protein AVDCRST_MAG09-1982 [uncultured Sphingomonas sp.]
MQHRPQVVAQVGVQHWTFCPIGKGERMRHRLSDVLVRCPRARHTRHESAGACPR